MVAGELKRGQGRPRHAAQVYTGTGTLSTMSRRIWSACSERFKVEEKRPLTTTRWAKTGTASILKSSGVANLRAERNARAWAARKSMSEPRGETPSDR